MRGLYILFSPTEKKELSRIPGPKQLPSKIKIVIQLPGRLQQKNPDKRQKILPMPSFSIPTNGHLAGNVARKVNHISFRRAFLDKA